MFVAMLQMVWMWDSRASQLGNILASGLLPCQLLMWEISPSKALQGNPLQTFASQDFFRLPWKYFPSETILPCAYCLYSSLFSNVANYQQNLQRNPHWINFNVVVLLETKLLIIYTVYSSEANNIFKVVLKLTFQLQSAPIEKTVYFHTNPIGFSPKLTSSYEAPSN